MARPAPSKLEEDTIQVPRALKLPVELTPPEGFDPSEHPALPDLAPNVADLVRQIGARSR